MYIMRNAFENALLFDILQSVRAYIIIIMLTLTTCMSYRYCNTDHGCNI